MIIEHNGFDRTTQDITGISEGSCVLEVWTNDVEFTSELPRGTYFRRGGQESCLAVEVIGGKFVYAINDEYLGLPPVDSIPTDETLYGMLSELIYG